jgi:hypothetical protein
VGQAPVDAVIERRGRGIKISPDQGAPYAAEAVNQSSSAVGSPTVAETSQPGGKGWVRLSP